MFNIKDKLRRMKEEKDYSKMVYKQEYGKQREQALRIQAKEKAKSDAYKKPVSFGSVVSKMANNINTNIQNNKSKPNPFRDSKNKNPFYNE